MKYYSLLLALSLAFCAEASHVVSGFFNYRVSSDSLFIELHIISDGDMSSPPGAYPGGHTPLSGPINLDLDYQPSRILFYTYNDTDCVGSLNYEQHVYTGALSLDTLSPVSQGYTFNYNLVWIKDGINLPSTVIDLSFTIFPKLDSNGVLDWHPHSNFGVIENSLYEAFGNTRNKIQILEGCNATGVDSSSSQLVPPISPSGLNYTQGFSGNQPLPDTSEGFSNGLVTYNSKSNSLEFGANNGFYVPGTYVIGIDHQLSSQGQVVSSQHFNGRVILNDINTNLAKPTITLSTPDTSFQGNPDSTVLNYDLYLGEQLSVDITANSNIQKPLILLDSVLANQCYFSTGANFNKPSLTNLNSNGLFTTLDSNKINFSWNPLSDNFKQEFGDYEFAFRFVLDSCEASPSLCLIKVRLREPAHINAFNKPVDTIKNCGALAALIQGKYNYNDSLHWSPGTWVVDSTNRNTQLITGNYGWLYLKDTLNRKLDSVYLDQSSLSINATLNLLGNYVVLNTNAPAGGTQTWTLSNAINLRSNSKDSLPILGSGSYSLNILANSTHCSISSDTLTQNPGPIYNANLSSGRFNKMAQDQKVVIKGSEDLSFSQRLTMPQGIRKVDELYLFGFRAIDTSIAMNLELEIITNQGSIPISVPINNREYLQIPLGQDAFILDSLNEATILFKTLDNMELQMIQSSDLSITNDSLYYSEFKEHYIDSSGTNQSRTTDLRFPLGIKMDPSVGLQEETFADLNIDLYPIPSKGRLELSSDNDLSDQAYWIYNLSGQTLMEGKLDGKRHSWNLNHLSPGVYFLKIKDGRTFKFSLVD